MFHSILFVVPYPLNTAPSQRFRFEQYLDILQERNYKVTVKPFIPQLQYEALYYGKNPVKRFAILATAIVKRMLLLTTVSEFDFVFIHREAMPVGPPIFEWILTKILRKKVIYDFDDAIWLTDNAHEAWIGKIVRWRSKVGSICRWSFKVSVGNQYLQDFAFKHNYNAVIIPTTIDDRATHNPDRFPDKASLREELKITGPVIGWTGSHSTLKYAENLFPVINKIQRSFPDLAMLIIADRPPAVNIKNMVFRKWSKETEVKDLLLMDIGIMPLPDDQWTKGKCGFKALQYMAMGLPTVASPVGVNSVIVEDGVNGFLCSSEAEWTIAISRLLSSEELRTKMGARSRETVSQRYSVIANTSNFLSLFH